MGVKTFASAFQQLGGRMQIDFRSRDRGVAQVSGEQR